jgi:hypothetical protein
MIPAPFRKTKRIFDLLPVWKKRRIKGTLLANVLQKLVKQARGALPPLQHEVAS